MLRLFARFHSRKKEFYSKNDGSPLLGLDSKENPAALLLSGGSLQLHHRHAVLTGAGGPCGDRLRVRAPRLPGGTSSPRSPPSALRGDEGFWYSERYFNSTTVTPSSQARAVPAGTACAFARRAFRGEPVPPGAPPPLSEGTRGFDIRNVISIPPRSRRLPPRRSGRVGRLSHSGCA